MGVRGGGGAELGVESSAVQQISDVSMAYVQMGYGDMTGIGCSDTR